MSFITGLGTQYPQHFGVTYNCLRTGGDRITLTGHNFGLFGARVTVNGRHCHSLVHDVPETQVSCTAPEGAWNQLFRCMIVANALLFIRNGRLRERHHRQWCDAPSSRHETLLLIHWCVLCHAAELPMEKFISFSIRFDVLCLGFSGSCATPCAELLQHRRAAPRHQLARRV